MPIPFDLTTFLFAAAAVTVAYILFGITAFGAALLTVPVLSHFYPPDFVLPLAALLDITAGLAVGGRFVRNAERTEIAWLASFCLIGVIAGFTLLVTLPDEAVRAALGVFLLAYGAWALRSGVPSGAISRAWAPVAGFTGGVMGTLFGAGGPPYAIYLSRRLTDKDTLRATLSNMVLLSVSMRAAVFIAGGLMLADRLIGYVMLLPFVFGGLWVGSRIHGRVSRAAVLRVLSVVLLAMGVSLIVRVVVSG